MSSNEKYRSPELLTTSEHQEARPSATASIEQSSTSADLERRRAINFVRLPERGPSQTGTRPESSQGYQRFALRGSRTASQPS
jgi:hypothetical protein